MSGLPWLVADVGGTNARFALVEAPGGAPGRIRTLPTGQFPGLAEAAASYLERHADGARPGAACLAVAGAVGEGRFRLTNAGWRADSAAGVGARLGIGDVRVINDFAALAMALPSLGPDGLRPVGGPPPSGDGSGTLAVVGPGTGLGVAALVPVDGRWVPVPGEGGHVDLPAGTDVEIELLRLLRAESGVGNAEYLLSGGGLARMHRSLALIDGVRAEPLTAAEICARPDDPRCARTLETFCGLLGSFAGNAALTFGARGGVYLGGGILPRIGDLLERSAFRRRFEGKPPVEEFLRGVPTALIVHPGPALAGAAALLAQDRPAPVPVEEPA